MLRYEGSQSESVLTNAMQVCAPVDSQFCCLKGGAPPVPHPFYSRNIRCLWAACHNTREEAGALLHDKNRRWTG
eukprot:COSAG01_NODE_4327_length_5128_cov_23.227833_4_plen_74_part_00